MREHTIECAEPEKRSVGAAVPIEGEADGRNSVLDRRFSDRRIFGTCIFGKRGNGGMRGMRGVRGIRGGDGVIPVSSGMLVRRVKGV